MRDINVSGCGTIHTLNVNPSKQEQLELESICESLTTKFRPTEKEEIEEFAEEIGMKTRTFTRRAVMEYIRWEKETKPLLKELFSILEKILF